MPDPFVVDTDVLSYVLKRDTRAQHYLRYFTGTIVIVSFMSLAELERWALERNWGTTRRTQMRRFLDRERR